MSSSAGDDAAVATGSDDPIYVTQTSPNDVLLGRGAPIIRYIGNVRFRDLIQTRKNQYNSTSRHNVKDEISRQIFHEIVTNRGGRFLQQVTPTPELIETLNVTVGTKIWKIVDNETALEKIKQTLRGKDPPTAKSASAIPSNKAMKTTDTSVFQSANASNTETNQAAPSSRNPGALPAQITSTHPYNNTALFREFNLSQTGNIVGLQPLSIPSAQLQPFRDGVAGAGAAANAAARDPQSPGLLLHQQQQQHQRDNEQRREYLSAILSHQRRIEELQMIEFLRRQEDTHRLQQYLQNNNNDNSNISEQQQQMLRAQLPQPLQHQQPASLSRRQLTQEELHTGALTILQNQQHQLNSPNRATGETAGASTVNASTLPGLAATTAEPQGNSTLGRSASDPTISKKKTNTSKPVTGFARSLSTNTDRNNNFSNEHIPLVIRRYQEQQEEQQKQKQERLGRNELTTAAGAAADSAVAQYMNLARDRNNDNNDRVTRAINHPQLSTNERIDNMEQQDHYRYNNEGKRSEDDNIRTDGNYSSPNNASSSSSELSRKLPAEKSGKA